MNRFLIIVSALLLASGVIAKNLHGGGSVFTPALTRIFLNKSNSTLANQVMVFNNETDICNFYGSSDPMCSQLAPNYYAGWTGNNGYMLAIRFPSESSRAHLYGGGAVTFETTANLVAALDNDPIGTTLTIPINGWPITGCFKKGGGTINGVTCMDLSTKTINNNTDLAGFIQTELNTQDTTSFGTITAKIDPVSFPVTASSAGYSGTELYLSAVSGTVYPGAELCTTTNPCLAASGDNVGRITAVEIWAGTTTGVGQYGLYAGPPPNGSLIASYGILSVTAQLTGIPITTPMAIGDRQAGGNNLVSKNTYLWQCIANCPPAAPSVGSPQQWIIGVAQTVASETMTVFAGTSPAGGSTAWMSGSGYLVQFLYQTITNGALTWGQFTVQPGGVPNPDIPVGGLVSTSDGRSDANVSTIACATGSAAPILRLNCGADEYPGVPYSYEFASTPGDLVTNPANWLTALYAANPIFGSCEVNPDQNTPVTQVSYYVDLWAQSFSPAMTCPQSWITTPPSTPPLP